MIDNVALPLEIGGVARRERRARAGEALELVGLGDWTASMPGQLSGGMKQRVGLARGLAMNTPILLMDEPFSALDPVIRRDLQDELLALQASVQKTIVFITHDLNEAVRVGDRIAIMRDGEVVQLGVPNDVVLNPADAFVREFTQDVRLHGMVTAVSIMDTEIETMEGSRSLADLLTKLEQPETTAVCCVDSDGRYLGTADLARARQAERQGANRIEDAPLYVGDHRLAGHRARRPGPGRAALPASAGGAACGRRPGRHNPSGTAWPGPMGLRRSGSPRWRRK